MNRLERVAAEVGNVDIDAVNRAFVVGSIAEAEVEQPDAVVEIYVLAVLVGRAVDIDAAQAKRCPSTQRA